jgi:Ca2+-binding RTX toxin-like protein
MRLNLEQLDARDNPSISFVGGVLTATGGEGGDSVFLYHNYLASNPQATFVAAHVGFVDGQFVYETVSGNVADLKAINVSLGGGNDFYANWLTNSTATELIDGGAGDDFLMIGRGGGVLLGGDGSDYLCSSPQLGAAPVTLDGGAGADTVCCGSGTHDLVKADAADLVYNFNPAEDAFF